MMSASESTSTFTSRLIASRSRDAQCLAAPRMLSAYTAVVVAKLRDPAPYAAIELVLPGGSLMALLLWLYRRQKKASLAVKTAFGADGGGVRVAIPSGGAAMTDEEGTAALEAYDGLMALRVHGSLPLR